MKISELIKRLEEVQREYGDIDTTVSHEYVEEDGSISGSHGPVTDLVIIDWGKDELFGDGPTDIKCEIY